MKSGFLRTLVKNWQTLAGLLILAALWRWDALPTLFRAFVLVPMYLFLALQSYLLMRSIFCRLTTDRTGDDAGEVALGWAMLTPAERVRLMIFERVGFVIAAAIIIAGMLIIFGGFGSAGAAIEAIR